MGGRARLVWGGWRHVIGRLDVGRRVQDCKLLRQVDTNLWHTPAGGRLSIIIERRWRYLGILEVEVVAVRGFYSHNLYISWVRTTRLDCSVG